MRLQRRLSGSEGFTNIDSDLTGADGAYEIDDVKVARNAEYQAIAPSHDNCATAQSSTAAVAARGRVSIKVNDKTPKRGSEVRITGAVRPKHPNTKVRLQQRRGGGWETVLGDSLDRRSRYLFEFTATGPKSQRYRVHWLGAGDNEPGTSKELTLKLHK